MKSSDIDGSFSGGSA